MGVDMFVCFFKVNVVSGGSESAASMAFVPSFAQSSHDGRSSSREAELRRCRMRGTKRCFGYFEIGPRDINGEEAILRKLGGGTVRPRSRRLGNGAERRDD